ncbi:MAG: hypothetical protein IPP04_15710 [Saprospiraceae bacterium]|nr:hypothetical protein [Saprospiraceae bacterium]MBK9931302.1 hypothetical protein [Saprospiraceae bacterium]MBL0111310.1 hypothetical protein [Saprospiraceae bacterium]
MELKLVNLSSEEIKDIQGGNLYERVIISPFTEIYLAAIDYLFGDGPTYNGGTLPEATITT